MDILKKRLIGKFIRCIMRIDEKRIIEESRFSKNFIYKVSKEMF